MMRIDKVAARRAVPIAALWILSAAAVGAAGVRHWVPSSPEQLAAGTLEGVAVDATGKVRLAPEMRDAWGPDTGVVWSVAAVGRRDLFVALSGPARVLRLAEGAPAETWYESSDEVLVTAVAPAGKRGVYYGLSPSGRVVHQTRPDERSTLLDTGSLFVWSILPLPDGTVWIAAGAPGRLIRHRPGRDTVTVFEAEGDPIRSLAPLPGGGLVAGTGVRGRVIRFDPAGARPFVLLDADEEEIVALAVGDDGTVFALAAGEPRRREPARGRAAARQPVGDTVRVTAQAPDDNDEKPEENDEAKPLEPEAAEALARAQRARAAAGTLYRIDPDGTTLAIWSAARQTPFSMVLREDGRLLVGTGEDGRILELDRHGQSHQVAQVPSEQVSVLARAPDGRLIVGAAADARVSLLGPGPAEVGSWIAEPVDAESVADWGRVRWEADVPAGAALGVEARSGNTGEPDTTWSDWVALAEGSPSAGAAAGVPPARWLQLRVSLRRSPDGRSPVLRAIEAAYRPRNRPPEIRRLTVEPPGIAWTRAARPTQDGRGPVVADDPVSRRWVDALGGAPRRPAPIRKQYEAGVRTFSWDVADADEDRITYRLEIRKEHEAERWFLLAAGLDEDFLSWDSRAMPDGDYRVRLGADDAAANPEGKSFTSERVSEPFRIDNTPPRLADIRVSRTGRSYVVTFTALDPGGRVEAVEYALDGRGWQSVDPVDGVADSEEERYRIEIDRDKLSGAARQLMLRVSDPVGNLGGDMRPLDAS